MFSRDDKDTLGKEAISFAMVFPLWNRVHGATGPQRTKGMWVSPSNVTVSFNFIMEKSEQGAVMRMTVV